MRRASSPRKTITIADVAREAGVTSATVSFALSGKRVVAPDTREAVINAVERLGYAPNPHAVRLANGRCADLIPLFTLTLDQGVGTQKLLLIQRALHEDNFRAPIHGYDYHAANSPAEQVALMRDIRMQRPRAVVCATAGFCADAMAELRRFQEEGGLAACLAYGYPASIECDQVILDEEDNTYQSTQHLLTLGHRRIGFYKVAPQRHEGARTIGFRRALKEFGAEYRLDWHFSGGAIADQEDSGAIIARQWAALPLESRPTGMCIVNDRTAQGFIVAAQELGFRVPEDVSVVGHDDQPPARFGRLPLTTVSHPVEKMVEVFLSLLRERLNGYAGPPRHAIIKGELIVRQSTDFAADVAAN